MPFVVEDGTGKVGLYSDSARRALEDALRTVAVDEFDLPWLDVYNNTPTWNEMLTLGMATTDSLHMRAAGQAIPASLMAQAAMYAARLAA